MYASGWPLRNAWNHDDKALRELLLQRGAIPQPYMLAETHDIVSAKNLLDTDPGEETVRELAWSAGDHGCPEIVQLAIARLNWQPDDPQWHWILIQPIRGATLDHASRDGHFQSMKHLLNHGISPNISRYGQTALHFAAGYRGNVSDEDRAHFAAMLVEHGASVSLRDDLLRSTPLGWACRWGRKAMATTLLAQGAPWNEPEADSWATPSAWARKSGNSELLSLASR